MIVVVFIKTVFLKTVLLWIFVVNPSFLGKCSALEVRNTMFCRTTLPLVALYSCLTLAGCVGFSSERMSSSLRFRPIHELRDIAAVYSIQGDSQRGSSRVFSYALFGTYDFSATPDSVRFRSPTPSLLICEALSRGRVVASREMIQDRDFRIEGGAMRLLSDKTSGFGGEGRVGLEKTSTFIRLTESGDAVMTEKHSEVAMTLLVIPGASIDITDTVFTRLRADTAHD